MASKFFEHFVQIVDALNTAGGSGLWDDQDGFYYDQIDFGTHVFPLKTRSLVGLLPLIAVEIIDRKRLEHLPGFKRRYDWFCENRPDLARHICDSTKYRFRAEEKILLAVPSRDQLVRVVQRALDGSEFLSPHGLRGVSKFHGVHPYVFHGTGSELRLDYTPAEGNSYLFGGNSNWRGPIWFPVNYLLIEALECYYEFYGDSVRIELPGEPGWTMNLGEAAGEISRRLGGIFLADERGRRPVHGEDLRYADDPHFRSLVLFYEYFHGDNGRGVGASHQTGWTSLAVRCLEDGARRREAKLD
jgi:hypothetical protein